MKQLGGFDYNLYLGLYKQLTVMPLLIASSSKKHTILAIRSFGYLFSNYTFQSPVLITCATTMILQHLLQTLWHRLNKNFAVFFNCRVSISNLIYGLYEIGFWSIIKFS